MLHIWPVASGQFPIAKGSEPGNRLGLSAHSRKPIAIHQPIVLYWPTTAAIRQIISMTTMRTARLAVRIDRFVQGLLSGLDQSEAYKLICPRWKKLTENQLSKSASAFAKRPEVVTKLRSVLASTPAEKIMSQGEWGQRMLQTFELSVNSNNLTAAAAFGRLIGQYNGAIKDTQVNVSWGISDEELERRLGGDDPAKRAAAAMLLGKSSFDNPPASDTIGPERPDNATKH